MALRILASRLVHPSPANGLPLRVCTASMASSTPAPTSPKAPATGTTARPRSAMSRLGLFLRGYYEPADPNDEPIPVRKANLPHITEHATGEEKLFLLAFENGIIDPYCALPVERGSKGTKDDPVLIESFFDDRLVACACEPSQTYVRYMYVYKGEPKRCQCGYWLKCVDAPRFWEKIPKEDLLDIAFFRDMEEEGKLDKFLETGEIDENYPKLGQ